MQSQISVGAALIIKQGSSIVGYSLTNAGACHLIFIPVRRRFALTHPVDSGISAIGVQANLQIKGELDACGL